jgi:transposase
MMPEVESAAPMSDASLPVPDGMLGACGRERRLVVRTRERFAAVQELCAQGLSLGAVSRQLGLDHGTVRRFARATSVDELLVKATHRTSTLDRFKAYVNQRWNEGCHDAVQFAHRTSRPRLDRQRADRPPLRARLPRHRREGAHDTAPPKPRRVVRTIMSNPDNVNDEDKAQLRKILARCPELDAVAKHVRYFAAMMRDLRGDRLDDWMRRVQDDDLPALHSFVIGVKRDHDAVVNGLTMSWNSGPVEGAVTRIKLLKRMGYGRANLDLLRSRVLHGT